MVSRLEAKKLLFFGDSVGRYYDYCIAIAYREANKIFKSVSSQVHNKFISNANAGSRWFEPPEFLKTVIESPKFPVDLCIIDPLGGVAI